MASQCHYSQLCANALAISKKFWPYEALSDNVFSTQKDMHHMSIA